MKDSFILYTDYREQIESLSMQERGELFTAIMRYASGEELNKLSPVVNMAFSFIRSRMDRDAAKYTEVCEKRREAGRRGGLSKSKQMLANARLANQSQANLADNDNDNDNVIDNANDLINRRERPYLKVLKEGNW